MTPRFHHWLTAFAALRAAGANAGRVELEELHAVNITSSSTSRATGITICLVLAVQPSEHKKSASKVKILHKVVICRLCLGASQIGRACGVWPCLCSRHAGTNGTL